MEESTMRYGARSTYRRKGYWLTALAAAGLLAASSGTAWAQVREVWMGSHDDGIRRPSGIETVDEPSKVTEAYPMSHQGNVNGKGP